MPRFGWHRDPFGRHRGSGPPGCLRWSAYCRETGRPGRPFAARPWTA